MQDKYFNLSQEFIAMQRDFQSPNYPELNKRLRLYFFLFHIQTSHPQDWKMRKLPWKLMPVDTLLDLSRENKLPKPYEPLRLMRDLEGYMEDLSKNSDPDLGFINLVPLKLPNHTTFWKSYVDDTDSVELLNIFKGFVNDSVTESSRFKNYEDSLRLKNSLDNFKNSH